LKNIAVNKAWVDVLPLMYAVGNTNYVQKLYLCDASHGMHRMFKSKFCKKSQPVQMIRIDDEFFGNADIEFVKIDVEGSELDVINGMYETLWKYLPTMLVEFHPPTIQEKGDNPEKLYYQIKNLGYDIRLVPKIDESISYEDLYAATNNESGGQNILCLKK
jgi:FkbM family methyltransferase